MGAAKKIIGGFILIIIGLALFVDSITPFMGSGIEWVSNFIIVLTGIIPILLILIGLFVVWLEIDELKVQREMNKQEEEQTVKKKTPNKKKK